MKKSRLLLLLVLLLGMMGVSMAHAQTPVEVRIEWYNDGNEGDVLRTLLDDFEKANADIKVTVDTVPYDTILQQLPLQVQAGQGPDIARVTDAPGFAGNYLDLRPLLKDAKYWDDNFPASILQSMRTADDKDGLHGFPNQFTITGPYINKTLFDQAKVAVPTGATTWEEWTTLAAQVAKATDTKYAIAMDRSGHRFSGPAMSEGATLLDANGKVTIDSPGFRAMANIMIGWNKDGLWPADVWLGSGGSYAAGADYFINGQLVFYMSGSWQIQNFAAKIGDAFDWVAVPNPTGPGGSTGMPGGTTLVAFKETQHPQETARVMEFLASHDTASAFAAKTLIIPGNADLAKEGVKFETDSQLAKDALNAFLAQVPSINPQGYMLNGFKYNSALFNAIRDRLTQAMTGELTLDEAIARAQDDVDKAIAATPTPAPTVEATPEATAAS